MNLIKPVYPKKAKGAKGIVRLRLLANREGVVEKACKIEGNDILAESAIKAAMGVKLDPFYTKKA